MNIEYISGIAEKRAALLKASGIYTIKDLLLYYPRDYDDRSQTKTVDMLIIGAINTIRGFVKHIENIIVKRKTGGNLTITKFQLKDHTGVLEIVWFNQPYLEKYFKKDIEYVFTGRVNVSYKNRLQMESPEYERLDLSVSSSRIVPIYTTPKGYSQKTFRQLIHSALKVSIEFPEIFIDDIPNTILKKYNLCDKKTALRNIHFPKSNEFFMTARHRLVFEELFFLQIALKKLKSYVTSTDGIKINDIDYSDLKMPFEFTNSQKNVIDECLNNLQEGNRLNRLIQGDVGSGKTAVALVLSYIVVKNGYQVAIMAPTEVLARQHYKTFSHFLGETNTILLVSGIGAKAKRDALDGLKSGRYKMAVGTHALIQDVVEFNDLALVITDEQHRFGVNQRFVLSKKGLSPHIIVMTATPIPRTLALVLHSDLDISIINELPPGRQPIKTYHVGSSYRSRIYEFIRKEAQKGYQTYVICPAIDEWEGDGGEHIKNVLATTNTMKEALPELKIEYLHGKMKPLEKQEILDRFKQGNINIIVSTTVIEVGIHVDTATLIIIENAERFGLSGLHQLRGRVGRSNIQSYCILITDIKNKETRERMKAMVQTSDGFKLSEIDLALRGSGDFFGVKQHGLLDFKIANLYTDVHIMEQAKEATGLILPKAEKIALENNIKEILKTSLGGVM